MLEKECQIQQFTCLLAVTLNSTEFSLKEDGANLPILARASDCTGYDRTLKDGRQALSS